MATTYNNIGLVLQDEGNLDGVLDEFQRALAIQKQLAPNSLTVATTRNNIGSVLRDQGEHLEGC
jgi:Tfp pilus assembly protein PilF